MMEDFYRLSNLPFYEVQASNCFEDFIKNDHLGKFWMITFSGKTIGYLILTFGYSFYHGGRDAFIEEIYLKKEYRNQGFGTHILESLHFFASKHDVKAIHLKAEQGKVDRQRLYMKAGFKGSERQIFTKIID